MMDNLRMDLGLAEKIFNELYKGIDGFQLSLQERRRLNISSKEFTYGEILFRTFVELLKKVKPEKDDIFYDLGTGVGKPCLAVSLAFKIKKAVGIEILPLLKETADKVKEKAKKIVPDLNEIEFRLGDYLKTDYYDASLVFAHVTCLDEPSMVKLEERLLTLKPGARVIVITKTLTNKAFELKEEGTVEMTWGPATYRIYLKT